MTILADMDGVGVQSAIAEDCARGAIPPFVYCYPPRSAYRQLGSEWTVDRIWGEEEAHSRSTDVNVYIHVPFCRYKCGFCNLYTVIANDVALYDRYVEALCQHLRHATPVLSHRRIRTLYIGGGTPTLLATRHFRRIFDQLSELCPDWRSTVEEIAIEASPDSIVCESEANYLENLVSCGVDRVNLGIQSMNRDELIEAGRSVAGVESVIAAIARIRASGVANLSVDLMMGFLSQSDDDWAFSVDSVLSFMPETVSTYFLTIRPDAWFAKVGRYSYHRSPTLYQRYDFARQRLLSCGYVQESNVRYKLPGRGGYVQKVLHFHGVPVLGIGAGARTYTNTVDYVIGGGTTPGLEQILQYIAAAEKGTFTIKSGFVFDDDERVRKRVALDLFDLDLAELKHCPTKDELQWCFTLTAAAENLGLLRRIKPSHFQLTSQGYKFRDILSWAAFSRRVRALDRSFYQGLSQLISLGSTSEVYRTA